MSNLKTLSLFVAPHSINEALHSIDVFPRYKWLCQRIEIALNPDTSLSAQQIRDIIEESRAHDVDWIPAVGFDNKVYVYPDVKEISSGVSCFFIEDIDNHWFDDED